MSGDPFDLARFVNAQARIFNGAMAELQSGRKQSHWMWFVFPQLRGLGHSQTAQVYGLSGLMEAGAYLQHPVLGARLDWATRIALTSPAASLRALFGSPDDLKFRSSMTLFAIAGPDGPYKPALDHWCAGQPDHRTVELLGRGGGASGA